MWQENTADVNGDGQVWREDQVPWCEALAYCEDLNFAGHDDWRLPNVSELQSVARFGSADLNPGAATSHWSSSSVLHLPQFAWYVGDWHRPTYLPVIYEADKSTLLSVRAVRNAP